MRKLIAAVTLLPAVALAGGYAVPNLNPRDLALAGSGVAAQEGAAAVHANPAALAGLPAGLSLSLAGTVLDNRTTWSDPSGAQASSTMKLHPALPPSLYAAYGGRWDERGYGIGVGLDVPFGGNVYWPSDSPVRFDVVTVNRRVYAMYLNGGIDVLPQLRLGGGLIYYRTTEELKQAVSFVQYEGSAELGAAGGQLSFQLAAEAQPFADVPLKIGVDYKHQAVQKLTGKAHYENPPPSLAAGALDQDATHFLTVPNTLAVGLSYRVTPGVLLTGAWTMDRFEVYKSDTFTGSAGTTIVVPRDYKNGYTYRVGGEVDVAPQWKVRAGLLRDISPTPKDRYSPSIPDADTWAGAVGASYAVIADRTGAPALSIHAAYFYAKYDKVTSEGSVVLPSTYDTHAHITSLGITWATGLGAR
jgi:long-chain fatty acid transport protein